MVKELVKVHGKEPRASTYILKDGFGFDHRYLVETIGRFREDFDSLGVIPTQLEKPTSKDGGRPIKHYLLNEEQCMYLGTLFRNTPKVRKFKLNLVKEFTRMKKALAELSSAEWLEKRKSGKLTHRVKTDVIKDFVSYCEMDGSKNAKKYYMNIAKMENAALFLLQEKYPNVRDVLNGHQLSVIQTADQIVAKALKEGMEEGIFYKDIYKLAKKRVLSMAELVGKSIVPMFNQEQLTQE